MPGICQEHDENMKDAIRISDLHDSPPEDVFVIPFAGGTPSGDPTGTTLLNTDFSDTYEVGYFS